MNAFEKNSSHNTVTAVSRSYSDLPSSAPGHQLCCQCKPSTPPAFRFFICGRLPLCLCVTGPTLVSSASQATLTASVTEGAGLFRTSERNVSSIFSLSLLFSVSRMPSLLLTKSVLVLICCGHVACSGCFLGMVYWAYKSHLQVRE